MEPSSPARDSLSVRIAGEIALSSRPGETLRKWRRDFKLKQVEVANRIGISLTSNSIENDSIYFI